MNEHEISMAKALTELQIFIIKSAENVDEKRSLVDSFEVLKKQLTLIVGRRIIKETYKNG